MAYKEVKMEKGQAKALFGGFNDDFMPKMKDQEKATKKTTKPPAKQDSKKRKIH